MSVLGFCSPTAGWTTILPEAKMARKPSEPKVIGAWMMTLPLTSIRPLAEPRLAAVTRDRAPVRRRIPILFPETWIREAGLLAALVMAVTKSGPVILGLPRVAGAVIWA